VGNRVKIEVCLIKEQNTERDLNYQLISAKHRGAAKAPETLMNNYRIRTNSIGWILLELA
jgi:hypothetical protein